MTSNRVQSAIFSRLAGWGKVDFRLLALALIISRVLVLVVRVVLLPGRGDPNDLRYFLDLARMSDQGLYPYINFWAEYPPVFPWIIIGAYKLSLLVAAGATAERLFYVLLIGFLIACELCVFWLLYRLATLLQRSEITIRRPRLARPPQIRSAEGPVWGSGAGAFLAGGPALYSALLYLALFVPGYLWTGWFDVLPVCLYLTALYLLLTGRERWSAAAVGLGIVSKLFPLMALPIALCTLRGLRRQAIYAAISGSVVLLFSVPFFLVDPSMTLASVHTAFVRPSWETIWALFDHYYGYGMVAPLAQHLDVASAQWAVHGSTLPWSLITGAFGLAFAVFYLRAYGRYAVNRPRQVLAGAAFTLTLLILYSRGYSPQYITWIAPLLVILYPNRQGAFYLGLWGALNVVEILLYISFFPDQHWILFLTVTARTVLLVLLASGFLKQALSPGLQPLALARARSMLRHGRRSDA
jgi:hypothetical protein